MLPFPPWTHLIPYPCPEASEGGTGQKTCNTEVDLAKPTSSSLVHFCCFWPTEECRALTRTLPKNINTHKVCFQYQSGLDSPSLHTASPETPGTNCASPGKAITASGSPLLSIPTHSWPGHEHFPGPPQSPKRTRHRQEPSAGGGIRRRQNKKAPER